jgi:ABC-type nitrate/sulfonate/bicarbonate transport system ATPase subunit
MLYAKKETLLKVENVSLKLGGKQILRDVNFHIEDIVRPDMIQGQIIALIGQSGAGKSTLFSLLAGLRKPDTGSILAGDKQLPVKIGDMGVVYQDYWIYDWRKVRSILTMAALKNPLNKKTDIGTVVTALAEEFSLSDHLEKFPKELSGGQKQRVSIAEQILVGSEFLLLDEPFSGLDIISIDKVIRMLVKASCVDEKKTLVIVSHDLSNAVAISDTVYVLAKADQKEGGTIVKTIDLIERDLAWHDDVKEMPKFKETIKEIKSLL